MVQSLLLALRILLIDECNITALHKEVKSKAFKTKVIGKIMSSRYELCHDLSIITYMYVFWLGLSETYS